MKFNDFRMILSPTRVDRYFVACDSDTKRAMSLYRLNLCLSQEVYTLLSCFEVALRNAIDREMSVRFGGDWLRDSILSGGIFDIPGCRDSAKIIAKAYQRLLRNGTYSHHKLIAEMEFGVWKYMYAGPQYRASGRILLGVFPDKPRSSAEIQYNNAYIFNELDGVNILRNRIAHHEPVCFARKQATIDTSYIMNGYHTIHKLFCWMGIDGHSLLYGLDHVCSVCKKIEAMRI